MEYMIEVYSAETGGPRLYHREKRKEFSKRNLKKSAKESGSVTDTLIDHELKKIYWLDKVNVAKKDSTKN